MAPVAPSTAVTPPTDSGLLDNNLRSPVDGKCQNGGPEKENDFDDPQCKAGLQHRTCLVDMEGQGVAGPVAIVSERAKRNVHRTSIPVRASGPGNKAQLVDTRNEGTEEEEVDKSDEHGRALGGREADQGIDAPESRNDADDEENKDVGRGNLVRIKIAIDKICLELMLLDKVTRRSRRRHAKIRLRLECTYHHSNDRNQEDQLQNAVADEEKTANHLAGLTQIAIWSSQNAA